MLDNFQLQKLDEHVEAWIRELSVERSRVKNEVQVTSEILLPWLQSNVASLHKRGLYVRGDGGPTMKRLRWAKFDFYPDLAIVEHSHAYAAFEVKLLPARSKSDPLTKAIGQTLLYKRLGFENSYGIVFDLREGRRQAEALEYSETLIDVDNARVHIFR